MSVAQLPINVWDEVFYLVDSTKDLLSLGLTCQAFKKLIISTHLESRYIRCDLRRSEVWKALATRPRLARAVRTIKLVHEPVESVRLPRIFGNPPKNKIDFNTPVTKEHMTFFQAALRHMTFLSELDWKQKRCSFDNISKVSDTLTSTVSPHYFKTLSVYFDWIIGPGNQSLPAQYDKLSIWNLTTLTKVVLHNPGPAALQMLLHCSDIEALSLWSFPSTLAPQLLQSANWKKLQHLHLVTTVVPPAPNEDISNDVISFFNRHPNLETLSFAMAGIRKVGPLPPSCLPKLRSIGWEADTQYRITDLLPLEILTHLVHWECPIEEIDIDALPQMDQLESLRLPVYGTLPEGFDRFLQHVPKLKKISVLLEDMEMDEYEIQEQLITSFTQCSQLTHIFSSLSTDASDEDAPDPLEKLSVLPHLQYAQVLNWGEEDYVKLDRDEDGRYTGNRSVTLEEAGGDPENWGGFFFHL